MLLSLDDDIQKIAYVQCWSVGELMSAVMEEYRDQHKTALLEYEKIKK